MSNLKSNLIAAKASLRANGITTGKLVSFDTGAMCLLGAVGDATVPNFVYDEKFHGWGYRHLAESEESQEVIEALVEQMPESFVKQYPEDEPHVDLIWRFNDRKVFREQEIFDLIDAAIEAA